MNEILVGVKPIDGSTIADSFEKASASANCLWLTIDGKELPVDGNDGLLSVEVSGAIMTVTVRLACSRFETVRWDGPDAPERFRKGEAG